MKKEIAKEGTVKIGFNFAVNMLKNMDAFNRYPAIKVVDGKEIGDFFGVIDEEFTGRLLADFADGTDYTAYFRSRDSGDGMEGGWSHAIIIIDNHGEGFCL